MFAWFPIRTGNGFGNDIALAETIWLEWIVAHEYSPSSQGRSFQCYRLSTCPFLDCEEKKLFAIKHKQFKKEYEKYEKERINNNLRYVDIFKEEVTSPHDKQIFKAYRDYN